MLKHFTTALALRASSRGSYSTYLTNVKTDSRRKWNGQKWTVCWNPGRFPRPSGFRWPDRRKKNRPRNGLLTFVLYIPVSKHCAPHSSCGLSLRWRHDACCLIHRESKAQKSPMCDFLIRNPLLALVSPSLIHTWAHVLKHLCSVPHIRPCLWIQDQKDPKVKIKCWHAVV